LFIEKNRRPHPKLFLLHHAVSPFSELQTIVAFKIEGKEMHPIFVFAKCCWSVHSKVIRLGRVFGGWVQLHESWCCGRVECFCYVALLLESVK